MTELNHIPIDTVATVATVATRRVDKHRTCVRGRRMQAKAAVRDLSAVNLEHARSLHGHLPGNYMVPYLQLRQPDLTFSSLRPGCARFLQASLLCPQAPSSASSLAIFLTRIIRSNRTDYDLISFTLALFEILCNCDLKKDSIRISFIVNFFKFTLKLVKTNYGHVITCDIYIFFF